jgi:hypothetical protein
MSTDEPPGAFVGIDAALRAHAEVDSDLLRRLAHIQHDLVDRSAPVRYGSVLDEVGAALSDGQALLESVDEALGAALRRYDEIGATEHTARKWLDDT